MSRVRETLDVRRIAVEHHHRAAAVFVDRYADMRKDRLLSAFSYGRHKIDLALDSLLKDLPRGASILDVGCGTGEYLTRFSKLGFDVAGVEPADGMRELAVAANPSSDVRSGLATELPWPDQTFDLVICIEVLRYLGLDDHRAALREMRRVLKPGGRMFLTMVNRHAMDGFWLHYQIKRLANRGRATADAPHCEFVTPRQMEQALEDAGFSRCETRGVLLGPLRLLYKVNRSLGATTARWLEPIDDALCRRPGSVPFAGHLLVVGTR